MLKLNNKHITQAAISPEDISNVIDPKKDD
jgi:hypothetical protein